MRLQAMRTQEDSELSSLYLWGDNLTNQLRAFEFTIAKENNCSLLSQPAIILYSSYVIVSKLYYKCYYKTMCTEASAVHQNI